jgi:inhibitor of KinA
VLTPGSKGASRHEGAMSSRYRIVPAGESVLIVEFEDRIDPGVNARTIACAEAIQQARLTGVRDVVPTYRSVAVYFDPLHTDGNALTACLERAARHASPNITAPSAAVRIPVCYGGDHGPDLPDVASFARMTEADVIRAHAGGTYRVFMLGFVPGFAYLGIVDERIAMPRHATPRVRVPAGSVAIAGVQTGIYPTETPGGWQLIGRTPLKPFDPTREQPFLLKAGDAVQFDPIDQAEYERMTTGAADEQTRQRSDA